MENQNSTLSERFSAALAQVRYDDLPVKTKEMLLNECIDTFGLMLAARRAPYVRQALDSWDGAGKCTALGHKKDLDPAGAAMVNGMAIHGEDFDDTLEGAPIRVAAMTLPAALAAAEQFGLEGKRFLQGLAVGLESICRLNRVAAGKIHCQHFHPVGVIGTLGAAAGVSATLGFDAKMMAQAFGVAGSMSSGIIEYFSEGAWTKRLHPGWAAHSGYRAARLAQQGFVAPRKIFEGPHGFFKAYAAPDTNLQFEHLTEGVGETWQMDLITFKPYACGTMIHPFIDCMLRLAKRGVNPDDIVEIECKTSQGYSRLWEPLPAKQTPPNGYAAKFSVPWCMAIGFFEGDAGLAQFNDEKVKDEKVLRLSKKIHFLYDPDDEYPNNYTGRIKVVMKDGSVIELSQMHMRGGAREPLTRDELIAKFRSNVLYGGWSAEQGERLLDFIMNLEHCRNVGELASFRN